MAIIVESEEVMKRGTRGKNWPYLQICSLEAGVSSLSPHLWPLSEVTPCCDTNAAHSYSHQIHASASYSPIPGQFINTHTHAFTLELCCTSLTSGPVYTGCWGTIESADGSMLARASKGSTAGGLSMQYKLAHWEQATCISKLNQPKNVYLFGFSCCWRYLHLYLQNRSRVSWNWTGNNKGVSMVEIERPWLKRDIKIVKNFFKIMSPEENYNTWDLIIC